MSALSRISAMQILFLRVRLVKMFYIELLYLLCVSYKPTIFKVNFKENDGKSKMSEGDGIQMIILLLFKNI